MISRWYKNEIVALLSAGAEKVVAYVKIECTVPWKISLLNFFPKLHKNRNFSLDAFFILVFSIPTISIVFFFLSRKFFPFISSRSFIFPYSLLLPQMKKKYVISSFLFCFREPIMDVKVNYKNNTDGKISVEAIGVLDIDKLQLPIILQCEVLIPEANYSSVQEYIYNGD